MSGARSMVVRELGPDDFAGVADLLRRCGNEIVDVPASLDAAGVRELAERDLWQAAYIATTPTGRVVGMVVLAPISRRCAARPGTLFGRTLLVDRSVRGSTVARELVDRVGMRSVALGLRAILLEAPETNDNAIRLYRRYGARQTGRRARDGYVRFENHAPLITRWLIEALGPYIDQWPGLGQSSLARPERFLQRPGRRSAPGRLGVGSTVDYEVRLPGEPPTTLVLTVDRRCDEVIGLTGDLVTCLVESDDEGDDRGGAAERRRFSCVNGSDTDLEVEINGGPAARVLAPGAAWHGSYPTDRGTEPAHRVTVRRAGHVVLVADLSPYRRPAPSVPLELVAGRLVARVDPATGAVTVIDGASGRPLVLDEWPEVAAPIAPVPNDPVRRRLVLRRPDARSVEMTGAADGFAAWRGREAPGNGAQVERRVRVGDDAVELELELERLDPGTVVHVRPHWLVDRGEVTLHGVPGTTAVAFVPERTPASRCGWDLATADNVLAPAQGPAAATTLATEHGTYRFDWPDDVSRAVLESRWLPALEVTPQSTVLRYRFTLERPR